MAGTDHFLFKQTTTR